MRDDGTRISISGAGCVFRDHAVSMRKNRTISTAGIREYSENAHQRDLKATPALRRPSTAGKQKRILPLSVLGTDGIIIS